MTVCKKIWVNTWKSYLTVLALLCSCSASPRLATACSAPSSRLASLVPVSGGKDCPRSPIFLLVETCSSRAPLAAASMSPRSSWEGGGCFSVFQVCHSLSSHGAFLSSGLLFTMTHCLSQPDNCTALNHHLTQRDRYRILAAELAL